MKGVNKISRKGGDRIARKRMISPDFWVDEKLGICKRYERLFFMGLISNSDDEGYGRANVKLLKSTIFPYDDDLTAEDIEFMMLSLATKKLIIVYIVDEQEFYYLPNFLKHQVINKPTPTKLPNVPVDIEKIVLPKYYGSTTVVLPELCSSNTIQLPPKRKEKNIKENKDVFDSFESLWRIYPEKKGKGQISNSQKEKLFKIGFDELSRCIDRYKKSKPSWQAWQNGSTFFNSGYVDYLDSNFNQIDKPNQNQQVTNEKEEQDPAFVEFCKAAEEREQQKRG